MLVLVTALTSSGRIFCPRSGPACSSAPLMHSLIIRQPASVLKFSPPGCPEGSYVHSCCENPSMRPPAVQARARQLPDPASTVRTTARSKSFIPLLPLLVLATRFSRRRTAPCRSLVRLAAQDV